MAWFKYLKNDVNLASPQNFEYIQPALRRRIISYSAKRLYI